MIEHEVRAHRSSDALPREQQLAWKLASVPSDPVPVEADVAEMIVNRLAMRVVDLAERAGFGRGDQIKQFLSSFVFVLGFGL